MPFIGLGFVHVLVALYFAIHAVRTRRELYWIVILFMFPLLGSVVYLFAEYLPQSKLEQNVTKAGRRVARALDPGRELREARDAFEINQSAENQMRLALALLDSGQVKDAVEQYRECLRGPFGQEANVRFSAARAYMSDGRFAQAAELLQAIRADTPAYYPAETLVMLGQAQWGIGDLQAARAAFKLAVDDHATIDARAEYAIFALMNGDGGTAQRLREGIEAERKRWNRHTASFNQSVMKRLDDVWRTARG